MSFSELIHKRRLDLGLGVREMCRATERSHIPSPIKSAVYISRLEADDQKDMKVESASIDKLWAMGAVLQISPLILFLESRDRTDLLEQIPKFAIRKCEPTTFMHFIRSVREQLRYSLRDMVKAAVPWGVSVGYWSQLENDPESGPTTSGEKLWSLGVALDVDPLLLYVLSRNMDVRYLNPDSRDRLFS
ncbi:helix-turn-helix domain-containing protein [Oryzomonas rubra]|uniref:XRE family transcriptional regulator n=1 Tax=Oryzomonas rubra TaxID=2509454 RepID=A0A5A9X6L8_9BACT|nr:helix-turn-helix transcriptional regulator [Oryzomonas rubra]KAA0888812.1 XRE family transcriptional regulator [Oryzomonas rubra]